MSESNTSSSPGLLLVGLCTAVLMLLVVWPFADLALGGDQYMQLALRFSRGLVDVDNLSDRYRDYVVFDGHKYLPFGPVPAALLVPFVWVFGASIPIVVFGYALGIVNVILLHLVLQRIGVTGERNPWLVLLFFGGTPYLSVTLSGISTFFAHIVTTTFLLLGLVEFFGKRRLVLVGLFIGLAAATRMSALFGAVFFFWQIIRDESIHGRCKALAILRGVAGIAGPLALVALYNYARFGNPAESGFGLALVYSPVLDAARSHGLFSLAHVPKNLFMMLLAGPRPVGGENAAVLAFPYVTPSPWGMGMFFVSPALAYLFRANLGERLSQASWLAIAATLVPLLTYYGIGFVQFGYRYSLDFMPFAVLLVALGIGPAITRTARYLIAASVTINIWGAIALAIWI